MVKKDKRIDVYIGKSADFAKPVLIHIRELVHKACPDVEGTWKWGFPHFFYKGNMCAMAAFKQHCAFIFWKHALLSDPNKIIKQESKNSMGQLGSIKSLSDLPADKILIAYIKEAAKLNEEGVKLPRKAKPANKELKIPPYFTRALGKNKKALSTFDAFSYTNKKDYVEWVTEAKTEETRNSRLATAIEWMAEGKIRNWKYLKK